MSIGARNDKIMEKNNEFEKILDKDTTHIPQIGDIVKGVVLSASKAEVKLDIEGIMTGVVRGREMYLEAKEYSGLKPGDVIEATVIESENENGEMELSFKHAGQERAWQNLKEAYAAGTPITVRISEANRGGLLVNYMQIQAFLPVSQLSPENYPRVSGGDKNKILEKLKSLTGKELEVKVINMDKDEEKLIVSEKEAWQERQKDVLSKYKVGMVVEGTITAVTNFGIFLSFGDNLEGLIHISELAWQRIDDPSDMFKVSETIKAEIINIEGSKIFLSAKKLMDDPWKDIAKKYKIGSKAKGTILKINPFGLFIELEKDIHGLAHVSQLGLASGEKVEQKFKTGDELEFIVMSVEPNEHRLGLGLKEISAEEIAEKQEAKEEKKTKKAKAEKPTEEPETTEVETKEEEK